MAYQQKMVIDDNERCSTICNSTKSSQKRKNKLIRPFHKGNFVSILILTFYQAILLVDTNIKIGIYVVGVMLVSVSCTQSIVLMSLHLASLYPHSKCFCNKIYLRMSL